MTIFTADPRDYLGPTVYVGRHRSGDPVMEVDLSQPTVAPLGAGERFEVGLPYEPRHAAEVRRG